MDKTTKKLLKLFYEQSELSFDFLASFLNCDPDIHWPHEEHMRILLDLNAIKILYGDDTDEIGSPISLEKFRITATGRGVFEKITQEKRKTYRAWITLAIAIAAFIKSFFF